MHELGQIVKGKAALRRAVMLATLCKRRAT